VLDADGSAAWKEYGFDNTSATRHYRLTVTDNNNGIYVCLSELDLWGTLIGEDFQSRFEVTHQSGTGGRTQTRRPGHGALNVAGLSACSGPRSDLG